MVEQDYTPYLPMHWMLPASQLSLSMTASFEPNGHSCVWMSNVSFPHTNCVCLTSDILSLDFRKPLWWLLSQDDRLDDASLSEDTPIRIGLVSWWADVHDHHISAQLHKPLSVLLHILWQRRKSMKVAYPDALFASVDSSVSLLLTLRSCQLHAQHEGDWTDLSAFHARSYLYPGALHNPFFTFVANVCPQGIHLSFINMVVFQKHFLYIFYVIGSFLQPTGDCIFL